MTPVYGLVGPSSGELLTYRGAVITHPDKGELEWVIPGCRVVTVHPTYPGPRLPLRNHPSMAAVTWPLDRTEFRDRQARATPQPTAHAS